MSSPETSLPPEFGALEPFVSAWAIEGANNRLRARLASREADRVAFFEAAKDLLPLGLDYLDTKPLAEHSDQDRRLMRLLLSLAHVALAVEVQADDESRHAAAARYMTITRAPSDF